MPDPRIRLRLNDLCEEAGVTHYVVARDTGLHLSNIHRYSKGLRWPNVHSLYLIAKFFGVPMDEMVEELDEG